MHLIRRLWAEENVTFDGKYCQVTNSTVVPGMHARPGRPHPKLHFGGASAAAEIERQGQQLLPLRQGQ